MGRFAGANSERQAFEFVGIVGCDKNSAQNILANHDAAKLEHVRALLGIIGVRRNQLPTTFMICSPVL